MSDTLVIGAGISGLSTAWALLQRGHRVTVVESGVAGRESSWAGGGILSPLLPWEYPRPVTALALRSMSQYADWVGKIEATTGMLTEFWRCGMAALSVAAPRSALDWCIEHDLTASCTELPDLPGGLSVEDAVWLPAVAQVRNPRLLVALKAAVLRRGGRLHEGCAVHGIVAHAGLATAVETDAGRLLADRVVVATGAWSGLALSGLQAAPNIRPIRGQMLLFKQLPGALRIILYRDGLYLIPRLDGHLLVGSTLEDAGFDKSTDAPTQHRLRTAASELLPALKDLEPVQQWAGLRPGSPDNIPVIDRHPDFGNVYVNVGHYRYGVTLAPAASELLADLIDGKAPALDPEPYRWSAALQRTWTGPWNAA